jgi:uncharacterized protein
MTTLTVDTNVLASGFVGKPELSPPARVLDAWRIRLLTLVLSEHILTELARTFRLSYFSRRLSVVEAAANVDLLRQRTRIIPITLTVQGVATHPEDDLVLATAISGRVEYLITGDGKLQQLGSYEGVAILSPRRFVDSVLPDLIHER